MRHLVIAAVVSAAAGQKEDYVRYPGFYGGHGYNAVPNASAVAAAVSACSRQCDAGPACDCTSFKSAASRQCEKSQACPSVDINSDTNNANGMSGTAFASSEDGHLKLTSVAGPVSGALSKPDWTLVVDDTDSGKRQEIDGFGAAWTDATVTVFDELSASSQDQLMEELFGSSGIGLGFMRHTIGQSDLTPSSVGDNGKWSYDGTTQADPSLSHFDLGDAGRNMVRWLKKMFQLNPDILLLGSPWSPPMWMKDGWSNVVKSQYEDSWTSYFVKYLQAFKGEGVNVHAMTIQNEPLHSSDHAWTTKISQSDAARLSSKLSPAIAAAGLKTEIWAYDHNTDQPGYPAYVLQQVPAVKNVAWHCYGGGWEPMTEFHNSHPTAKQYMTECWLHLATGESFWDLPGFMAGPVQNYASGSLAWTLGGSTKYDVGYPGGCGQCSGIIQVDRAAKSYEKTHDYYTLGQFSKFVKKGAVYLSGSGSYTYSDGTGVTATQFLGPNGDRVVVIINKLQDDTNLQIAFKSGDAWNGLVPKRSVTTWVITSHGPPVPVPTPAPTPAPGPCTSYCSSTGCGWTAQYSCPWEPTAGSHGRAGDDGSKGYNCCCKQRTEKSQPCGGGPNPCGNYCSTQGCGWTSEYSCPWAPSAGSKGRAGDDGSMGFSCCCQKRTQESQPCGGGSLFSNATEIVV